MAMRNSIRLRASFDKAVHPPWVWMFVFLWLTTGLLLASPVLIRADMGSMEDASGSSSNSQSWWGDKDLEEAIEALVETLVKRGKLKGKPLLISPNDLYDAERGLSLPLALQLRGRLITEMTKRDVRVLLPGADEEAFMILQGTWQKMGEDLTIDLKVMKLGSQGPVVIVSASEKVPIEEIDSEALTPNRESWARYLIRKLEGNAPGYARWKVNVGAFNIRSKKCNPDLSTYLAGWIQPALTDSRMFIPLDQKRALKGLSVETLRKRGTRGIRPDHFDAGENVSLTADLMNADGEIKGEAWLHKDRVEVQVRVVSRQAGQQIITAAAAEIPSKFFPPELLKAPPRPAPVSVTPSHQSASTGEGLSKDGLTLDLTTTRGQGRAVYHDGEKIRFVMRLNRPARVYLFDLDSEGNATLLYPVDKAGRLARKGECGALPEPGTPLIIPEDGCSYDLVVTKPYGKDTVWAVAAETPLKFPSDLGGDWQNGDVLVKRLRNEGLSSKAGYAESQVEVVTGPR